MVGERGTGNGGGQRDRERERGGTPGRFAPGGALSGQSANTRGLTTEDEANLPVAGVDATPPAGAGAPPLAAQLGAAHNGSSNEAFGRPDGRSLETPITGPAKREVDLYVRTYSTLLQSSGAISVSSLEPAHIMAAASLHAGATETAPDMNAFMYSTQRLPACIVDVRRIVLAQSRHDFNRAGLSQLDDWEIQSAPGRRRRWLYDDDETLAAYIASASDLDDAVPSIVAWQIEWNKFNRLFATDPALTAEVEALADGIGVPPSEERFTSIGERLLLAPTDWNRLRSVWGVRLWPNLAKMAHARKRFTIQLLGGSHNGYARSARQWWNPIADRLQELELADRPLYFVSSNTHSIANVLSGTAQRRRDDIVASIRRTGHAELVPELERIERGDSRSPWENWLYFAARSYFAAPGMADERERRNDEEQAGGIHTIDPRGAVDVGVQIIDVAKLDPTCFDPRLRGGTDRIVDGAGQDGTIDADGLNADGFDGRAEGSDAVIININYPLGLAAYYLLSQTGVAVEAIQGIYVLGKAATLNGRIGDVMISNVVYDEHSNNTYWFDNCFTYNSLAPYLVFGDLLDNQKAVTVKGTYLQNQGYLDFFYREAYTVVEMEAGPYLSAICEELFPRRYPSGEAINLQSAMRGGLDLGILHYASDTPYTRAQTLGARGMDFYGLDSTYASTIAILRRIFDRERLRLGRAPRLG